MTHFWPMKHIRSLLRDFWDRFLIPINEEWLVLSTSGYYSHLAILTRASLREITLETGEKRDGLVVTL